MGKDLALVCAATVLAVLGGIFYFSTGRTALVIFVLFVLLALKVRDVKTIAGPLAAAIVLGIIAWMSSPYLCERAEARSFDFRPPFHSNG